MLDKVLSIVAPHHCCGCDQIGGLLCPNCKYNIVTEQKTVCVVCHRPTVQKWLCADCKVPYQRLWLVGERIGVLQRLIGLYKFERARSAHIELSDLLLAVLPELPENTIIVPIPTVSSHIRQRGYDHMWLIAKRVAKKRNLKIQKLLVRNTNTVQHKSTAKMRQAQAKRAFVVNGDIDPDCIYLLIDDVITTGATIKYAAMALKKQGAKNIWVALVSRQALK